MLLNKIGGRKQFRGNGCTVLVRRHGGDEITGLSVRTDLIDIKLYAGDGMPVQLVQLDNPDTAQGRLVPDSGQNIDGIYIRTVDGHMPFFVGNMIAVGSADLADRITAVGNFAEYRQTVAARFGFLNLFVVSVE